MLGYVIEGLENKAKKFYVFICLFVYYDEKYEHLSELVKQYMN